MPIKNGLIEHLGLGDHEPVSGPRNDSKFGVGDAQGKFFGISHRSEHILASGNDKSWYREFFEIVRSERTNPKNALDLATNAVRRCPDR